MGVDRKGFMNINRVARLATRNFLFWLSRRIDYLYRFRSAENIMMEMKSIKGKYDNRSFGFNDSVINGQLPNLIRLCDLMID